MFGNSRNSNVSSVNAWNPAPRWRTVFIALVLALATGSIGQTPAAQAALAPQGDQAFFSMKVVRPKTRLSCGETVTYIVKVEFHQSTLGALFGPDPLKLGPVEGIPVLNIDIDAISSNETVGGFVGFGAVNGIEKERTLVIFHDDFTSFAAKFKFKANKPGKTTLHFDGFVGKQSVTTEVNVTVIPCSFKIKTLGDYNALDINLAAIMDGEMKSDEQGNITGSGTVNWVGDDVSSGDCSSVIDIASSKAELTGSLDESGQLIVNMTYLPAVLTNIGKCENAEASLALNDQALVTPDPVRISISSSGGVSTQSQDLYEPNYYAMHGSIDIIVIPVEDEAVTFIPGDHAQRWDDFSSLFGSFLALH